MWGNRVIRSTAPLLCATTLAGAAVVGHLDRSSDATTVTRVKRGLSKVTRSAPTPDASTGSW